MDDFLHNLRNSKNKPFDRNRKHYDNPNYKGTERKGGKERKTEDAQRFLTPERITFITRFMDDLLNTQKQLVEIAEKRLAVESRVAYALEQMLPNPPQTADQPAPVTEIIRNESENEVSTATRSDDSTGARQLYNTRNKVCDLIFQLRNDDLSYRQIADRLKEFDIPTFSGRGDWSIQAIAKICKEMFSTERIVLNRENEES